MNTLIENIKFICWKSQVNPEKWSRLLAKWIGITETEAAQVLDGSRRLVEPEISRLANHSGFDESDIQFRRFVDDTSILAANLKYLFQQSPHGFKTSAARKLSVNKNTLSRWCSGSQSPTDIHISNISKLFGLQEWMDLKTIPLFLSLSPVGENHRKEWLKYKIDKLDVQTLSALYPALERLLR